MTDAAEVERLQCRICGATSAWERGFVDARSIRFGRHKICVGCLGYQRKYSRFYRRVLFWVIGGVAAGWIFLHSIRLGVVWAAIAYAILYASVIAHELGHALAARLVGFDVLAFSLGGGIRAKVLRWRDVFLIIGPFAIEGLVILGPTSPKLYRTKSAVVLFAGPLVNVVGFVTGLILLGSLSDATTDSYPYLLIIWTYANFAMIANLIPMQVQNPFGASSSDGRQLLRLRKLSDDDVNRAIENVPIVYGHLAFQTGDYELAYRRIEKGITTGKLSPAGRVLATAVLIGMGRTQEGIELARKYLQQDDFEPHERAVLQNNLAFALIVDRDSQDSELSDADELSKAAMELLPMLPAIRGTRGFVLVEKGEYRDAIELLADKRHRLSSRDSQATVQAFLATAWARLGETRRALKVLRRAARLGPNNDFVKRATESVKRAMLVEPAAI